MLPDGRALLSSVVSEFEDALSRLKQYVKSRTEADRSTDEEGIRNGIIIIFSFNIQSDTP